MSDTKRLMDIRWVLAGAANRILQEASAHAKPDDAARLNGIADAIRTFDGELAGRLARMTGEDDE
jgi:hypothetical protein